MKPVEIVSCELNSGKNSSDTLPEVPESQSLTVRLRTVIWLSWSCRTTVMFFEFEWRYITSPKRFPGTLGRSSRASQRGSERLKTRSPRRNNAGNAVEDKGRSPEEPDEGSALPDYLDCM